MHALARNSHCNYVLWFGFLSRSVFIGSSSFFLIPALLQNVSLYRRNRSCASLLSETVQSALWSPSTLLLFTELVRFLRMD